MIRRIQIALVMFIACIGACTADTFTSPPVSDDAGLTVDAGGDVFADGSPNDVATSDDVINDDTATPDVDAALFKRIFVTSSGSSGALGGLAGADSRCQQAANNASLGGTWKAWLSSSTTSAASRLTHSSVPYRRLDGVVVANDWTELTSGVLANSILHDEFGAVQTQYQTWTGTASDGSSWTCTLCNCLDWTSGSDVYNGGIGRDSSSNSLWTQFQGVGCSSAIQLYCLEQ